LKYHLIRQLLEQKRFDEINIIKNKLQMQDIHQEVSLKNGEV